MKLISELKDAITWGEEHYLNFESKSREENKGIIISGNEAKQIVKMYELLEEVNNFIDGTPNDHIINGWMDKFEKLKGE